MNKKASSGSSSYASEGEESEGTEYVDSEKKLSQQSRDRGESPQSRKVIFETYSQFSDLASLSYQFLGT